MSDTFDHDARDNDDEPAPPRRNRCGSHDVRWRQQGGRWVLFSLKPGVEHVCPIADDFDALD